MKRKFYFITILSILLFLLTLQAMGLVTARTESFTDPEDDVWRIDEQNWDFQKGDYHDEIDITSIAMADNYFNATFAANLSGPFFQCTFYLFEHYDPDNEIIEYGISAVNVSGVFRGIYFEHYVPTGVPDSYFVEVWTGTGWSFNILDGLNIGNITGNLFEGTVPPAAWTVPNNVTWYFETIAGEVNGEIYYADIAPNEFEQFPTGGDDAIPGYDLFIFIGALSGISIYIVAKRIKRK
jgi:hypothetical protein